jgi:hypothetical protein
MAGFDCHHAASDNIGMKIISAKALPGFRLELRYAGGESGVVDLSSLAGRGVFAAWNAPAVFESVTVTDCGAVEWLGEIDLCPHALYLQMTGKRPEDVFPALQGRLSHA